MRDPHADQCIAKVTNFVTTIMCYPDFGEYFYVHDVIPSLIVTFRACQQYIRMTSDLRLRAKLTDVCVICYMPVT